MTRGKGGKQRRRLMRGTRHRNIFTVKYASKKLRDKVALYHSVLTSAPVAGGETDQEDQDKGSTDTPVTAHPTASSTV